MSTTAVARVPAKRETMEELIHRLAAEEGIPVTGINMMDGKPYINVTGLDCKLRSKCDQEKLVHAGTEYIPIVEAAKENGMRAGGWGIIRLFDKRGFEKALEIASVNTPVTKDVLDTLKELYYYVFKMRGFASPETLKMASMKVKDNVEHMAERRATNRAKREATGTGLTSVEEMDDSEELPRTLPPKNGAGDGADPTSTQTASTTGTKVDSGVKSVAKSQVTPLSQPLTGSEPKIDPLAWVDEYEKAIANATTDADIQHAEFIARGAAAKLTKEQADSVMARMKELKVKKQQKLDELATALEEPNESQVQARRSIMDALVAEFGQERFLEAVHNAGLRGESDRWPLEKINEVSQALKSIPF